MLQLLIFAEQNQAQRPRVGTKLGDFVVCSAEVIILSFVAKPSHTSNRMLSPYMHVCLKWSLSK